MPLELNHLLKFLGNSTSAKFNSELSNLLIKRINRLCFEECQIDRIQCTLMPMCHHRWLISLRLKSGLKPEDLPNFCYSVLKGSVLRDFRRKTVIYKPYDAYIYLIDFLDIFFHGDYRKLNKFISIKSQWDDAIEIFDNRIQNGQDFQYHVTNDQNYIIFKFGDRIHVIFFEEKYALCNAKKENIASLELLHGLCELYWELHFPEFKVNYIPSKFVEIITLVPYDVLEKIKKEDPVDEESKLDNYFWSIFPQDIDALMEFCGEIQMEMNIHGFLEIRLYLNLETNNFNEKKKLPLRFRDLRLIFNFAYKLYNEFYIYWLE